MTDDGKMMLQCSLCGAAVREDSLLWRCGCGAPFTADFGGIPPRTRKRKRSGEKGLLLITF